MSDDYEPHEDDYPPEDPREIPALPISPRTANPGRGPIHGACPDGGTCHHQCGAGGCFRVLCCSPFDSYGSGDTWPEDVKAEHERRESAAERSGSRSINVEEKCTRAVASCPLPVYIMGAMATATNTTRFAITFSEGLPADGPDFLGFSTYEDFAKAIANIARKAADLGIVHKTDLRLNIPALGDDAVNLTVALGADARDLVDYANAVAANYRSAAKDPTHALRTYADAAKVRESAKQWAALAAALTEIELG